MPPTSLFLLLLAATSAAAGQFGIEVGGKVSLVAQEYLRRHFDQSQMGMAVDVSTDEDRTSESTHTSFSVYSKKDGQLILGVRTTTSATIGGEIVTALYFSNDGVAMKQDKEGRRIWGDAKKITIDTITWTATAGGPIPQNTKE